MGALHDGHMELVRQAGRMADAVVVSIFVNPTQFAPGEDFKKYPRTEKSDLAKLRKEKKAEIIYIPYVEEIYPQGFATNVEVKENANILCGKFRKGHFSGVATVVVKLLLQVMPDIALFGEKDFQQFHIIKKLVADLDIPVRIEGVPTVRESDGFAMSSRNKYLAKNERETAAEIFRMLSIFRQRLEEGEKIGKLIGWGKKYLHSKGIKKIDYLEVRDEKTLTPVKEIRPKQPVRIFIAAYLGKTRLIDNLLVG